MDFLLPINPILDNSRSWFCVERPLISSTSFLVRGPFIATIARASIWVSVILTIGLVDIWLT